MSAGGPDRRRRDATCAKLGGVRRIITEILVLLWKAFRLVLWKWLRPILGTVVLYALLAVGVVILLISIMR